jgi:hypothetical protein
MDGDPCVYVKVIGEWIAIIVLYVDDCTLLTHSKLMDTTKNNMGVKFNMVDLGEAKLILGFEIL